MTPPYPVCPCETCQKRVFKSRNEMVNGLLVPVKFPFCIKKSLDVTSRIGPCNSYDVVI